MYLGIDTSGPIAFVAIGIAEDFVELSHLNDGSPDSKGSENIYQLTRQVLDKRGVQWSDIKGIFIGEGPGSFTGLRIGFSYAQGLAAALKIPCTQIPSFSGWSREFRKPGLCQGVIADAQRGDYFCQLFSADGESVDGPRIIAKGDLLSHSRKLLGDSLNWIGFSQVAELGVEVKVPQHCATGVILEGLSKSIQATYSPVKLSELSPNYLRQVSARTLADRGKSIVP
jgi:tRNA threonylcarbamoyl adenosine modification protein YeaZ